MKSAKQYNEMTQKAAYQIARALAIFKNEPDHIRQQGEQIIMQRVQRLRSGDNTVIDGDDLVNVFVEPAPTPEPVPEPEAPPEVPPEPVPENPEADKPAP